MSNFANHAMNCGQGLRRLQRSAVFLCAGLLCVAIAPQPLSAQAPAEEKLSFDVASVRQNTSGSEDADTNVPLGPGDVYSPTGGLLSVTNMPLMNYISFAYRMTGSQRDFFAAAAPAWVRQDRFNLQARTERINVTKDQLRLMMRSLLSERFGMAVHYETRTTAVFALLLVKPGVPGPRLRTHPDGGCSRDFKASPAGAAETSSEMIDGGFPATCGGLLMLPDSTPTHFHIGARDVPITLLSNALPSWGDLGRPVVDQTGLTGRYDFALEFTRKRGDAASDAAAPTEAEGPDFLEALKKQLGLKLEAQKQGVQVLVLDHIEHLTDN